MPVDIKPFVVCLVSFLSLLCISLFGSDSSPLKISSVSSSLTVQGKKLRHVGLVVPGQSSQS